MKLQIDFFNEDFSNAISGGIYEVLVSYNGKSEVLYIGESRTVMSRCADHLYKLEKKPSYFGFTSENLENESIKLIFKLNQKNSDDICRKQQEKQLIMLKQPLSQSGKGDRQKDEAGRIKKMQLFLNQ